MDGHWQTVPNTHWRFIRNCPCFPLRGAGWQERVPLHCPLRKPAACGLASWRRHRATDIGQ